MKPVTITVAAIFVVSVCAGPLAASPASWDEFIRGGGIVVDQPPTRYGGHGSDTSYLDRFGNEVWGRIADNILLDTAASIRRVIWWGFYGGDEQSHEPPMGPETMRVRFYDARPGDGLPGEILYEESFLNPSRTATGEVISVAGLPAEYAYEVDFASPYLLVPQIPYWLEIVQVGDIESHFRWEAGSGVEPGLAFVTSTLPDWQFFFPGAWHSASQRFPNPVPCFWSSLGACWPGCAGQEGGVG